MARTYLIFLVGEHTDEEIAATDSQDKADRLIAALYHARNDRTEAELLGGRAVPVVPPDCEIELR